MADEQPILPIGDFTANADDNPMVRRHGRGPERTFCKTCRYIRYLSNGRRQYIKCYRRGISKSDRTDHRLKWNACRLWERERGEQT